MNQKHQVRQERFADAIWALVIINWACSLCFLVSFGVNPFDFMSNIRERNEANVFASLTYLCISAVLLVWFFLILKDFMMERRNDAPKGE